MNEIVEFDARAEASLAEASRRDQNPAIVYVATLQSKLSRETTKRKLSAVIKAFDGESSKATIETFPWRGVRYQHVAAFMSRLVDLDYAPATSNSLRATLRGVMRQAWLLGAITAEEHERIKSVGPAKGSRPLAGREVEAQDLASISESIDSDRVIGIRDTAMLALMHVTGMRRSEIASARIESYNANSGSMLVRGKGNKTRTVFVGTAKQALDAWVSARGTVPGPLFLAAHKSGKLLGHGIVASTIFRTIRRRCESASVSPFSPHDLRRTFVSGQLAAGTDLVTVQHMAGHSDPSTTAKYDRRGDSAARSAAMKVHTPFCSPDAPKPG